MSTTETELKFKLIAFPQVETTPSTLTQTYIDFNTDVKNMVELLFGYTFTWSNIKEIRVREKIYLDSLSYTLTLKSDGTLDRDEYEIKINKSDYDSLLSYPKLGTINKLRYTALLPVTQLVVELDKYNGNLRGLYIAEVEYNKNDYPDNTVIVNDLKELLGQDILDVTYDPKYKNRSLAKMICLTELAN